MNNCPCHHCENRHVGCHAECEVYKGWRAERDALNERIHEEKERYRVALDIRYAKYEEWKKKSRGHKG